MAIYDKKPSVVDSSKRFVALDSLKLKCLTTFTKFSNRHIRIKTDGSRTSDAFWQTACVLVSELSS